jgi:chaperonin GroEL
LGSCDKVISGKSITERIEMMKVEKDKCESDYEKEKIQNRLSKLAGGVAVIKIGAESEIELKEKKDRVDDAILSTKAALEEGIVPGGGSALIHSKNRVIQKYHDLVSQNKSNEWVKGMKIVYSACEAPLRAILKNAGIDGVDTILKDISIKSLSDSNYGYNASTEKLELNMVESGIVDPTKVTRTALEKAVSVAGTLLTTEAMVVGEPEKED